MSLMALTGGSALASGQTQAPAEVLVSGQTACDDCLPRVAVTTNLLHDTALTPDLGLEVSIARRWSVAAEGVWAWWSNARRHRYWRIAGGRLEFRWHPGDAPMKRALTGHHIGIYGSAHTFDFEFGGQGWQSPGLTFGVGLSYGYSWRIAPRLNLDVGLSVGYTRGELIKYRPACDTYTCTWRGTKNYFGPTGLHVTLVWWPGAGRHNNPDYEEP